MNSNPAPDWTTTAFDVLADSSRRSVLAILSRRPPPLAVETLATEVAVREHEAQIVTDEQVQRVHVELVHLHLPRLLEADVVTETGDEADETRRLGLADHPMLEAEWVTTLLEAPAGGQVVDERQLNRTLEVFRSARRRTICTVLARQSNAIAVADLAALVVAETADETRLVDVDESDWQPVATTLVHDHLPAIADAGLVDYDRESATVSIATDAPQWRMAWLRDSPLNAITECLGVAGDSDASSRDGPVIDGANHPDSTDAGACWTVQGRENVVGRGIEIADSADDELFVAVPHARLLGRDCLTRCRDAADRGVDVYVGSGSRRVREMARAAVPEATICEPRFDWLNFPVEEIHHGHLVLADRERVLLVAFDEETDAPGVAGITGTGSDTTLVRVVCEHLGPRLDRLDSRRDGDRAGDRSTPLPV